MPHDYGSEGQARPGGDSHTGGYYREGSGGDLATLIETANVWQLELYTKRIIEELWKTGQQYCLLDRYSGNESWDLRAREVGTVRHELSWWRHLARQKEDPAQAHPPRTLPIRIHLGNKVPSKTTPLWKEGSAQSHSCYWGFNWSRSLCYPEGSVWSRRVCGLGGLRVTLEPEVILKRAVVEKNEG